MRVSRIQRLLISDDPDAGRSGREHSRAMVLDFFRTLRSQVLLSIAVVVVSIAGLAWLVPNFIGGVIAGGLAVGLCCMWCVLAFRLIPLSNVLQGAEAEVNVSKALETLSDLGVDHLDDVQWCGGQKGRTPFNIDHVVVVGGTVWCLETKSTVGDSKYVDTVVEHAVFQAKRNAESIRKALLDQSSFSGGRRLPNREISPRLKMPVTPIVVLVGWPARQPDVSVVNGVTVVRVGALAAWLKSEVHRITVDRSLDEQSLALRKIREQSLYHRVTNEGARSDFVVYGSNRLFEMCTFALLIFLGVFWIAAHAAVRANLNYWMTVTVAMAGAIGSGVSSKKRMVRSAWLRIATQAAGIGLSALAIPPLVATIRSLAKLG